MQDPCRKSISQCLRFESRDSVIDLIGWFSAAILLFTIARQVYTQWRDGSCQGVSRWLFVGQIAASGGFVAYSWLLQNWVFVATNAAMLVTAIVGQIINWRNKRRDSSLLSDGN
jgi:MtN3 and saliva related transmembrane protein